MLKNDSETQQTQIASDGGIFHHDIDIVHDRITKFMIQEALLFNHFENPHLKNMIRETLQPRYNHVSLRLLRYRCLKMME
ncbi:hypothetical protein R6Q59_034306 [Mikania micrantha]